jgi:hypothetical protein
MKARALPALLCVHVLNGCSGIGKAATKAAFGRSCARWRARREYARLIE